MLLAICACFPGHERCRYREEIVVQTIFYPLHLFSTISTARGRGVLVLVQNFAARGLALA